jgi:quinoprotein glucose dehydrogenase
MLGNLNITDYNSQLEELMISSEDAKMKSSILDALVTLKHDDIEKIIKLGMEDDDKNVRTTALKYLGELNISKENLPEIVNPIFQKGTTREQQQVISVLGEMPLDKTETILEGLIDQMIDGKLASDLTLDLIETISTTKSKKLIAKVEPLKTTGNTVDAFKETLYGGDSQQGRDYFMNNSTGQCIRCHAASGNGSTVGPNLANIGNILTREQILEAMIEPSARLSPGFGTVSLFLKDGQNVTGTLLEEHEEKLILQTSEAEPLEITISRIEKRQNIPSSMPPMGTLMSKREIRDMVEFLANRKGD